MSLKFQKKKQKKNMATNFEIENNFQEGESSKSFSKKYKNSKIEVLMITPDFQ